MSVVCKIFQVKFNDELMHNSLSYFPKAMTSHSLWFSCSNLSSATQGLIPVQNMKVVVIFAKTVPSNWMICVKQQYKCPAYDHLYCCFTEQHFFQWFLPLLIKRSNSMQQYADIYLLQSHSTCFGRHSTHHQEY